MKKQSKHFWEVIEEINWESHFNYYTARKILLKYEKENAGFSLKDFENEFTEMIQEINHVTLNRFKTEELVFAEGIMVGADNCHLMDLPAHLIGLGRQKVMFYLKGGVINFKPMECLSYMFQNL